MAGRPDHRPRRPLEPTSPAQIGSASWTQVNDAKGWGTDYPPGNLEFDATSAEVTDSRRRKRRQRHPRPVRGDERNLRLEEVRPQDPRRAGDQSTTSLPRPPSGLGTNPKTSCTAGGLIGNTTVSLHAKIDDQDAATSPPNSRSSAPVPTHRSRQHDDPRNQGPGRHTRTVPQRQPAHRRLHLEGPRQGLGRARLRMVGTTCKFSLDRTRPSKPPGDHFGRQHLPHPVTQAGPPQTGKSPQPSRTFTVRRQRRHRRRHRTAGTPTTTQVNYVHVKPASAPATVPVAPPVLRPALRLRVQRRHGRQPLRHRHLPLLRTALGSATARAISTATATEDIWNVDTNGTLLTYAGHGNGKFSAATNGGGAFAGAQVASTRRLGPGRLQRPRRARDRRDRQEEQALDLPQRRPGCHQNREGYTQLTVACPVQGHRSGCDG